MLDHLGVEQGAIDPRSGGPDPSRQPRRGHGREPTHRQAEPPSHRTIGQTESARESRRGPGSATTRASGAVSPGSAAWPESRARGARSWRRDANTARRRTKVYVEPPSRRRPSVSMHRRRPGRFPIEQRPEVFGRVENDSSRAGEAVELLNNYTVPMVKQAPGFVSGTSARSADGTQGTARSPGRQAQRPSHYLAGAAHRPHPRPGDRGTDRRPDPATPRPPTGRPAHRPPLVGRSADTPGSTSFTDPCCAPRS
jgi:hypothetical protein